MAKLPAPPSAHELAALSPQALRLVRGSWLARIGFAGGSHPSAWNQFRNWGPSASRFDHHQPDRQGQPHVQRRAVLYAASAAQTCMAEVFQATRLVDVHQNQPWLAIWRTTAELSLLDLTGAFATRMGASTAIHSGPRGRARQWAAALYQAFPQFDGIAYCSSMNGNAPAFVLNERALLKKPFPRRPDSLRMLADPLTADLIDAAIDALGYMVKR
jgi:hypothetical protein